MVEQEQAAPELARLDRLPALADELRVAGDGPFVLDAYRADATPGVKDRRDAERTLEPAAPPGADRDSTT